MLTPNLLELVFELLELDKLIASTLSFSCCSLLLAWAWVRFLINFMSTWLSWSDLDKAFSQEAANATNLSCASAFPWPAAYEKKEKRI